MNCNLTATLHTLNKNFLVIGYGNDLRSDDAIGPRVAQAVEGWGVPNVNSLALHQLTPELAETLQNFYGVIFVDACRLPEVKEVQVEAIDPAESEAAVVPHGSDPRSLLTLTKNLYNHSLHAWLVTVPGEIFEIGETISSIAEQGIIDALEEIDYLLRSQIHAHQLG